MLQPVIRCIPWKKVDPPKKILAIRLQAMGDTIITLPYLQSLKDQLPSVEIYFLTRKEVGAIPRQLDMFSQVIEIGGGRNEKLQFINCLLWLPYLWWQQYDAVIDLQHNRISRFIRKVLFTKAWSEFDRSSPILAGERTRATIDALGLKPVNISSLIKVRTLSAVDNKLKLHGWNGRSNLVIVNPAGAFATRNWPLENYGTFVQQWLEKVDPDSVFVVLGFSSMKEKARTFKLHLKEKIIDLSGLTSPFEAYCIVRRARFVLTEDSGLMHMAWTQRVPTLAIFGSSPSYWSAPMGVWSRCLHSSDLPCGNCFLATCKFGDNHCLTRFTPERVVAEALELMKSIT